MRTLLLLLIGLLLLAGQASADTVRHEVRPGETLYGIARNYGLTFQELARINGIASPDLVLPGTILTVGQWYRVERGDTLFGIARSHDTTIERLRQLNGLEGSTIRVGQRLRIPVQRASSSGDTSVAGNTAAPQGSPTSTGQPPSTGQPTPTGEAPRPSGSPAPRPSGSPEEPATTSPGSVTEGREEIPVAVPLAVAVEGPITFAEGGAWPVAGTRSPLEGKLPGVMIRSPRGTPVVAVSAGRVIYAGPHSSFGNVVFVQSGQGYIYVYGGQEQIQVEVGDLVTAGFVLGSVGVSPAEQTGALYFSVWRDNQFVDPAEAPRG